jgi:hypothetical protein
MEERRGVIYGGGPHDEITKAMSIAIPSRNSADLLHSNRLYDCLSEKRPVPSIPRQQA